MYELVNVLFPFADDAKRNKLRPGFVVSPPIGKHDQVVVAYVTTHIGDQLDTDILLDPESSAFHALGLKRKSLIKLHRLATFQPEAIQQTDGYLSHELVKEVKQKLKKVFLLDT